MLGEGYVSTSVKGRGITNFCEHSPGSYHCGVGAPEDSKESPPLENLSGAGGHGYVR